MCSDYYSSSSPCFSSYFYCWSRRFRQWRQGWHRDHSTRRNFGQSCCYCRHLDRFLGCSGCLRSAPWAPRYTVRALGNSSCLVGLMRCLGCLRASETYHYPSTWTRLHSASPAFFQNFGRGIFGRGFCRWGCFRGCCWFGGSFWLLSGISGLCPWSPTNISWRKMEYKSWNRWTGQRLDCWYRATIGSRDSADLENALCAVSLTWHRS